MVGPRHVRRRARHRREDRVVERGDAPVRAAVGLHRAVDLALHLQRAGAVDDRVLDLGALHRRRARPPGCARSASGPPSFPLKRRAAPPPARRWRGRPRAPRCFQLPSRMLPGMCTTPMSVSPLTSTPRILPLVEVVRDDGLAGAVVRVVSDPAGAERVAVADLQQRALELVALARRGRARLSGGHSHSFVRGVWPIIARLADRMQERARVARRWPTSSRSRRSATTPPPSGSLDDRDRAALRRDRRRAARRAAWRRARSTSSRSTCPSAERRRPLRARRRRLCEAWRQQGVLVQRARARDLGAAPGLHGARRQRPHAHAASSRACAWRTTAPGRIRPHERTHPGPKEDRLSLTRATRANLSPIFSLFPDPERRGLDGARAGDRAASRSPRPPTHEGTRNRSGAWPTRSAIARAAGRAGRRRAADRRRPPPLRDRARVRGGDRRRGRAPLRADVPLLARRTRACTIFPTHRLLTGLKDDSAKQERDPRRRSSATSRSSSSTTPTSSSRPPTATAWRSATWTASTSSRSG